MNNNILYPNGNHYCMRSTCNTITALQICVTKQLYEKNKYNHETNKKQKKITTAIVR